jgi:hypothetical protein
MLNHFKFTAASLTALLLSTPAAALQVAHQHQQSAQHQHNAPVADSITEALLALQIKAVRAATERYADVEAARRDGYTMFGRGERPLIGEHWFRQDLVHQPLDLGKPSTLQYATINGKRTLVGVAFTVYQRPTDPVPEGFAGNTDHWHVHDISRMQSAITDGRPLLALLARARAKRTNPSVASGRTHLAMVHAWTGLDNPDGMFAERHRLLPYLQAGLPSAYAEGATENAAWGVALVQKGACDSDVRATDGLARLSRNQRARLSSACAVAEGKVLASYRTKPTPAILNRVSDDAWRAYLSEQNRILTPQQKQRMAAVVEHPAAGSIPRTS